MKTARLHFWYRLYVFLGIFKVMIFPPHLNFLLKVKWSFPELDLIALFHGYHITPLVHVYQCSTPSHYKAIPAEGHASYWNRLQMHPDKTYQNTTTLFPQERPLFNHQRDDLIREGLLALCLQYNIEQH